LCVHQNIPQDTKREPATQLLQILHEPVHGNGLLILAHQEIAAKLNIATTRMEAASSKH
jgi:hypothetical protein